jgi:hypothetical protein
MRLLFFTVLLYVSTLSIAQKQYFAVGYIIKADSALQAGYVVEQDSLPSNAMYFKDSVNSTPTRYEPNQILGYGFYKGKSYMSFRTSERVDLFFEKLNDGRAVFYRALSIYLVKRDNKRPVQLPKSGYIETLNAILGDCPIAVSKLQKLKLQAKYLRELAEEYNACLASSDPKTFKGANYVEARIALTGGLTTTTVSFDKNADFPQLSKVSTSNLMPVSIGVQTWLRLPNRLPKIALRTGIIFEPRQFNIVSNVTNFYQVKFSYKAFNVPFAIHYWLGKSNEKRYYATTGILITFVSGFTSSSVVDTRANGVVFIDETIPMISHSISPQFLLGVGRWFSLGGKERIAFDARYSIGQCTFSANEASSVITAKQSSFTLNLGYIFK